MSHMAPVLRSHYLLFCLDKHQLNFDSQSIKDKYYHFSFEKALYLHLGNQTLPIIFPTTSQLITPFLSFDDLVESF